MPESKKLSELINDLVWNHTTYLGSNNEILSEELINQRRILKNQIDQKFEELRCECRKKEYPLPKDWEEMVTLYAVKDYAKNKISSGK